jgi:hypothetical protein
MEPMIRVVSNDRVVDELDLSGLDGLCVMWTVK